VRLAAIYLVTPILALSSCSTEPTDSTSSEATGSSPGPTAPITTDTQPTQTGVAPTPTPDAQPGPTPGGPATTSVPQIPDTPGPDEPGPGPNPPVDPVTPDQPQVPTSVEPTTPVAPDPTGPDEPNVPNTPGEPVACETPEEETFSFFLISYEAIVRESGSPDGFGGDLGGIEGADALCQRVAEYSSPCAANKSWRAFLSTTKQDAIDRIGTGPWHDRIGRLFANNLDELANERPINADPEIINDFPNEYGIPNRNPDQTGNVDNHQTLSGSGPDGRLYMQADEPEPEPEPAGGGAGGRFGGGFPGGFGGGDKACPDGWTPEKATCWDWTSSEPEGCPRVGHSWVRGGFGEEGWLSFWNEGGCAPGVVLEELGGPNGDPTVGSAGGYGGFYCFAMTGE
jgi:hypothetical protein